MCRHYERQFYGGRVCALLEKVKIIFVLSLSAMSALKMQSMFWQTCEAWVVIRVLDQRGWQTAVAGPCLSFLT